MGYNLIIGEAVIKVEEDWEDQTDGIYVSVRAEGQMHPGAPAFNEPTDHTNERWPSYTAWTAFLIAAGIKEFFFNYNTTDIKGGHPGGFALTKEDIIITEQALRRLKARYPDAAALIDQGTKYGDGYNSEDPCEGFGWVARAMWLHYWVKWAVENCKRPVFANT